MSPPTRAAAALRDGQPIVVHDGRMCVVAVRASAVDAAVVTDFARHAGGNLAVALTPERADALRLPSIGGARGARTPDFTVSVDAVVGTTTGISAADRAVTVQALRATAPDGRLGVPGHVFPIRTAAGGTLERAAIAEACVDLAALAGIEPVVAICELLDDDGEVRRPETIAAHPRYGGLATVAVEEVRAHRRGLTSCARPDVDAFRTAMSALISGVAAVTVRHARSGDPLGLLATSITSYSDRPPSVLISVAHTSRTHASLVRAAGFGVHLLTDLQTDVARAFAGRSDDKFAGVAWEWDGDVPRIDGALAYLRCVRSASFDHHDHTVLIGDVEVVQLAPALPLVYFQRAMGWTLQERAAA